VGHSGIVDRVVVFGSAGSGKTTLARKLANEPGRRWLSATRSGSLAPRAIGQRSGPQSASILAGEAVCGVDGMSRRFRRGAWLAVCCQKPGVFG